MRIHIWLFAVSSAQLFQLNSIFQPLYEQVVKYGKDGLIVVLTEIRDSETWNSSPTVTADDDALRDEQWNNLISDINSATHAQIVEYILQYNDIAVQNLGLTTDDLTEALEVIFVDSGHTILTDPEGLSAILFDETEDGYFTLAEEEELMVIVTDFVAIINDMHQLFQLDVNQWELLLTDVFDHSLAFYVNLDNIFTFSLQSYIGALIEVMALGVGTFSEWQNSIAEYSTQLGWAGICSQWTPGTIRVEHAMFTYASQWLEYGKFLLPRWIDVINNYISFWNELAEMIPFLANMSMDLVAPEIPSTLKTDIIETFENGKLSIDQLKVFASLLDQNNVIDQNVEKYLC